MLPQEEFEASIFGRILRWATGSFRIIVIVTELVVMGAFLSRFWLDAQNSDLNDRIKILSAQISAQKDVEDTFKKVQAKLNIVKGIDSGPKFSDKIDLIASKLPQEVTLSSVTITANETDIKGVSTSELGIAQFMGNLKADETIKKIELGAVGASQNDTGKTDFSIKLTF